AHSSGRFFWIQACTSAPFTAPGMRMSEITPEYFPPLSMFNPSAPDAALATAYPWRSSAARRKAVTEGSSSMSRMGTVPVWVRDASAVIGHGDLNRVAAQSCPDSDATALPRFLHCVVRVVENIQKNLLQLLRITERRREFLVKFLRNFHAVTREIIAAELNCL